MVVVAWVVQVYFKTALFHKNREIVERAKSSTPSCSRIIATFMAHTVENREKVWNVRSVKYRSFSASRRRQEDLHEAHGMICKHCFTTGNWAHGRVHVFIRKLKNETVSQKPGNRRASEK